MVTNPHPAVPKTKNMDTATHDSLMGLYQQALSGDAPEEAPSNILNLNKQKRELWEQWNVHRGLDRHEAMRIFADLCIKQGLEEDKRTNFEKWVDNYERTNIIIDF